ASQEKRGKGRPLFPKGTGLGLSIVKAWVERHGGEVTMQSAGRGKGATFEFTLPLEET
ncbi:hypothetical protein BVX98_06645, partial [bacterium F11]